MSQSTTTRYFYNYKPNKKNYMSTKITKVHVSNFSKYEAAGMRVSTSKLKATIPDGLLSPVGSKLLPQVKEVKYLEILLTLYRTTVWKKEPKLSILRSIYVPTSPMVMGFG